MTDHEESTPYTEDLSVPTLMGLLATYTNRILVTNGEGEEDAFDQGKLGWDDAFQFGLPKQALLAEVNRMAWWCRVHRSEADAAWERILLEESDHGC